MKIRSLNKARSLSDLSLESETIRTLEAAGINAKMLVSAARNDTVWQAYQPDQAKSFKANRLIAYPGIGKVRAAEIIKAVDKAGFLLQESNESLCSRRLVTAILGTPLIFLNSYESLEDMSPEALAVVTKTLNSLHKGQKHVLEYCFGFEDGEFHTVEEYAKNVHRNPEVIWRLKLKGLTKLSSPENSTRLRIATCYSRDVLYNRIDKAQVKIYNLQEELNSLKRFNPYA